MRDLVIIEMLSFGAASVFLWFSIRKEIEIAQMVNSGATPVFHDFLVQSGLMGAAIVFGALGIFGAIAAVKTYVG